MDYDRQGRSPGGHALAITFQFARDEYLSWLQLEANRSPNTVRAYAGELRRLLGFLVERGHSLNMDDFGHDDVRAYQRHLAERLQGPASRARALTAIRSWLRWLAREGLMPVDLSNGITLPRLPQRLPKPIPPEELARLLARLPSETEAEKRDRALVNFLISTGCRISEALALDRSSVQRQGNRLIVTGKGDKQRAVYLTDDAKAAVDDYLQAREDTCLALFINYDRARASSSMRRLTPGGARHVVNRLRKSLGAWSFRSPHVARHTAATNLLEVTGGDVRLVQEVLGHANLNTLAGYTKIVDQRKQDAYRLYQRFLSDGVEESRAAATPGDAAAGPAAGAPL
ncbi:MAG: tyrosine-type recombinase/integrase [Candidatus Dormibacteraceae bacterium]